MTLAVEKHDPYTAGHQKRVAALTSAIAAEMGLSEEQIKVVAWAAALHDLGKIHVPSEILNKLGRLSAAEFDLIKGHSDAGYGILKRIEFPWPIAQIVRQHHERVDGSGYPLGLTGDQILPEARILGVADVVEAMAAHRPYRPALGIDAALEEIATKRSVLYDPQVTETCCKLFTQRGFTWEQDPQAEVIWRPQTDHGSRLNHSSESAPASSRSTVATPVKPAVISVCSAFKTRRVPSV